MQPIQRVCRRQFLQAGALAVGFTAGCVSRSEQTTAPTVTLEADAELDGWPMYGYNPAHTAATTDTPPAVADPAREWVYETRGVPTTAPVIAGDIVTIGTTGGAVVALRRSDGALVWRTPLESYISGQVVADGTVYVATREPMFVALDARTGEHRWQYRFDRSDRRHRITRIPAVADDVAIATLDGSGNTIHAASKSDGERRWAARPMLGPWDPVVYDECLYVSDIVLDIAGGDVRHRYESDTETEFLSPAITDDAVYLVDIDGESLFRFPIDEREPEWSISLQSAGRPVVADDTVYVRGQAISAGDGKTLYQVPGDSHSAPAVSGNLGVVLRSESVAAFNTTDGKVRWEREIRGLPSLKQPVIGMDRVYVPTYDGVVALA